MIRALTPPPEDILGVRVRPSTRARRMSLRVDPKTGDVILVWPKRTTEKKAQRFVAENESWIAKQRAVNLRPPPAGAGDTITILGRPYTITHRTGRGVTRIEGGDLIIHGRAEYLSRRLRDFLKAEAARILTAATREKTEQLGLKMREVRVRDPKTRWGSCAPDGQIMFSWRLILTPESVMDYVVAHEVAHRIHMNHSRKFWTLCASLTHDASAARRWIRAHGQDVMHIV